MDNFIAISALVYGAFFGACFLYLKSDASKRLSEEKRETVWTYMLAVISIADIFGWVKNGQPLLLFGIAMLQLCSLENDYYKFKTRLFYLLIGLIILVGNLLIVIL